MNRCKGVAKRHDIQRVAAMSATKIPTSFDGMPGGKLRELHRRLGLSESKNVTRRRTVKARWDFRGKVKRYHTVNGKLRPV